MKTHRYLSLDVFRGITIAAMITVNNPGSWSHIYSPLKHAAWNGCTPTDLVFPFFLFIVGVSMFFSFEKHEYRLDKKSLIKILKRTVLIFFIGLFLNSFPQWQQDFSKLRIMGVLQRIALAYGFGSIVALSAGRKMLPFISLVVLIAYWALLRYAGGAVPFALEGNIVSVIDTALLGEGHIYKGFGIPFDPEGLLSTIPSIVTVLIGYMAGEMIRTSGTARLPVRFILIGALLIATGLLWSLILPLNKPLWTSSYVIYTAGCAFVLMAALIWIIEIRGYTWWTSFFAVFGMNPLFIFALSGIWARMLIRIIKITDGETTINGYNWLYQNIFQSVAGDINGSLAFALAHIVLFWFICWVLYKNKIFIKV